MGSFDVSVKVKDSRGNEFSIENDLDGKATLSDFIKFVKKSLIVIAADVLKDEQSRGFDKNPIVVVDGSVRKPIISVKPFGKIEFISSQTAGVDVIKFVYEQILGKSKVVTGTYYKGNFVFHNGNLVATDDSELLTWIKTNPPIKPGDIIRFVNVVPYARRLERLGVTAQRTKTKQVKSRDKQKRSGETILGANGVYFLASRAAASRYKNNVKIYFGYILGSTLGVQNFPTIGRDGKPLRRTYKTKGKPKNTGPYLYPYIKLTVGERGLI